MLAIIKYLVVVFGILFLKYVLITKGKMLIIEKLGNTYQKNKKNIKNYNSIQIPIIIPVVTIYLECLHVYVCV